MRVLIGMVYASALAACGRIGFDALGDGRGAAIDASPDASMGTANVIAYQRGGVGRVPEPDALVWSSTADGSVDDVELTDAAGLATVHVFAGGAVSASYAAIDPTLPTIHTVLSVQPGDTLTFGLPSTSLCPDNTPRGTATATFTAFSGAVTYDLNVPCYGAVATGVLPFTIPLYASTPDPCDVVINASSASSIIGAVVKLGVPFGDGASYAFGDADWQVAQSATVGLAGLPVGTTPDNLMIQMSSTPNSENGGLYGFATELVTDVGYLPQTATTVQIYGGLATPSGTVNVVRMATSPDIETLTKVPPQASAATFDPVASEIAWTPSIATDVDLMAAQITFAQAAVKELQWSVWASAPSGTTRVALPQLPSTAPTIDGSWTTTLVLHLDDFDSATSYRDVVARPEWHSSIATNPGELVDPDASVTYTISN